ncbi:alpha/beta hydrolase [Aquitalea magnusonii]|uniref:Arylformamidase n=1 Tax=Aquitalea magnusonii TaxID=332411 RepID=A0A318JJ25_9NEIS|nr:alpha/beta hydrolase [Aquitalea magnusonii]PXX50112.1 arylformamidase [Aquitalea magnusonii]
MRIDLTFPDLASRAVQYNARASVADFDACMEEYAVLAIEAKARVAGLYDLPYGMAAAERLDVFPACQQPAPLFVFIHGGYWHSQRKEEACGMAPALHQHGVALATVEYTLLPQATLAEVVREVRSAIAWLYRYAAQYGIDPQRIYVGGSSAGAHLVGMLYAQDWQQDYGLPPDVIKGALALSGLYDIRPLCDIYVNDWLRLYPDQAARLSPLLCLPPAPQAGKLRLSVGGKETDGFRHQTLAYHHAALELGLDVRLIEDSGNNHFSLVNELSKPDSRLFRQLLEMIGA